MAWSQGSEGRAHCSDLIRMETPDSVEAGPGVGVDEPTRGG